MMRSYGNRRQFPKCGFVAFDQMVDQDVEKTGQPVFQLTLGMDFQ